MRPLVAPGPVDPLESDLREFADRQGLAARSAELDTAPAFPRREFRAMGDAGWLGLRTPARWGGRGLSLPRAGRLLAVLAGCAGTTFAKLSLQPEFCTVLAEHGSDAQIAAEFRPLVAGQRLIANQVTEPDAGSDVGALRCRALPSPDGFQLSGTKSGAAFAVDAEAAIVYARTAEADGVSAFLVPQDLPGITRTITMDLGERWMRRGSVHYSSVQLPSSALLGERAQAWGYLAPELTRERALLASIYLGVARDSWARTCEYVAERRTFGRRLADHEAVGFPLQEDRARLEAAELFVDRALRRLDEGEGDAGDAALAKWLAVDTALQLLDHAVQFHGGRGYSKALPHEQRWRDVRSGALAHGTNEMMLHAAGRAQWGREGGTVPSGSGGDGRARREKA